MSPPILALKNAGLTYGTAPLFSGVELAISPGDKVCLVGRNGSGKSTLLKALAGIIEVDKGERFVQPGTKVAYLPQDPSPDPKLSVNDYVSQGLDDDNRDQRQYRVRDLIGTLGLDPEALVGTLSGGALRKAAIARAFVGDPDVLLLDEPTNHLDIATTLWLEKTLASTPMALLLISHDRAFLRAVTRRTFWLDRGNMRVMEKGYSAFDEWSETIFAEEEAVRNRLEKKLIEETEWLHKGVTARRRRNQGRLRELHALRDKRQKQLKQPDKIELDLQDGPPAGRRIVEARNISKSYGGRTIIDGFSTRIMRGDRVGIVGPNGAGKTTLIKLLTGEIRQDSGQIKLGTNLEVAYFDQTRARLDPKRTLWETLTDKEIGGGGDSVNVQGVVRHVVGYLKDFLFDPSQARQPVGALSGGEKNRLLLAKLFTKQSNVLILDEPTNDLDMDMLDVLEDIVASYAGTVLLVSHDRDFLDRMVTSTISFDPDGKVREYAGGYSDMLMQRGGIQAMMQTDSVPAPAAAKARPADAPRTAPKPKMTYKDQRELENLPGEMEALERDIAKIEGQLADPRELARDPDAIAKLARLLDTARKLLERKQDRWLELEMMREDLEGAA
ncbi:ATP-binding cassette domain-containing protein [Iodidimonas sp. SYSU 1G8]|uniref:ABC-F family ATP-binding cassette domain-containing protein n=1 Tax=Iodidimonas sp. SYSU 1G8 TaxID=3133967 RepID=UPI0031FEAF29